MKTSIFFTLVGAFFCFTALQPTQAFPSSQQHPFDDANNYVVIGAFAKHTNAIRFTRHAKNNAKLDAKFEMNRRRNLYYVYVLTTPDLTVAIEEATRLRTASEFTDTWVYKGSFTDLSENAQDIVIRVPVNDAQLHTASTPDGTATAARESAPAGVNRSAVAGTDTSPSSSNTTHPTADASSVTGDQSSATTDNQSLSGSPSSLATDSQAANEAPPVEDAATAVADDGKEGTQFIFRIMRQTDQKKLQGDVDIIDVDRTRKMGSYKGNTVVRVASPASKSGNMALICEVFGYRKVQREINYDDPETGDDIIRDATGSVVIPFELTRLKKGDIAIMYNVYFFKDASIMRPESRFEVNSLLDMLNENTKYKIRLHGHTNGNAAGKVISMGKNSESFFALDDTREGFGSAKQLSEERATIIRDYLIKNGIDAKRMEIRAWGGKKPIHDKMSARAVENVRVEVEILED